VIHPWTYFEDPKENMEIAVDWRERERERGADRKEKKWFCKFGERKSDVLLFFQF
jgi:hypothetical protein